MPATARLEARIRVEACSRAATGRSNRLRYRSRSGVPEPFPDLGNVGAVLSALVATVARMAWGPNCGMTPSERP